MRDEIANNEPLAACLKEDVNNRVPANSEAVVKVLRRELLCRKGKFIVIGFPRNADNLTAWNKLADEYVTVKCLLLFKVSFEAIK